MPDLVDALAAHLSRELDDALVARQLAVVLMEDALAWRVDEIDVRKIRTVLAFTFGNRMQPNGNRTPGPVNMALAAVAVAVARASGARIVAQWEVAEAIGDAVPSDRLVAIYPAQDERAEPRYLSTDAVISRVASGAGDPASLGVVGVVAFRDHLYRCVASARAAGLDAHAPAGHSMPSRYDPDSGQPWCRTRLAYLAHDIALRAAQRRDRLAAGPVAGDRA